MNVPDRDLRAPPDKRLVHLDDHCLAALKEFDAPGCSVAAVVNQKIVYAKGFGTTSDAKNKIYVPPVDADTVYPLGNASDAILGLVVASLVQEGLVQWDTPLVNFLPTLSHPLPYATSVVTIGDLLSHRAGLPNSTSVMGNLLQEINHDLIPAALKLVPAFECSTFRGIVTRSNITSALASLFIQRVLDHTPLEVIVRERIWDRVGASIKSGFEATGKTDVSGGMVTTVRDLARLATAVMGGWGPVGSEGMTHVWNGVGVMNGFERAECESDDVAGFAMSTAGWISSVYRGKKRVGFGGESENGSFQAVLFPIEGIAVIVMSNQRSHLPMCLANTAADFLLNMPPGNWLQLLTEIPYSDSAETCGTVPSITRTTPTIPTTPTMLSDDGGWQTHHSLTTSTTSSALVQTTPHPLEVGAYTGTYSPSQSSPLIFRITADVYGIRIRFNSQPHASQLFHLHNNMFQFTPNNLLLNPSSCPSSSTLISFITTQDPTTDSISITGCQIYTDLHSPTPLILQKLTAPSLPSRQPSQQDTNHPPLSSSSSFTHPNNHSHTHTRGSSVNGGIPIQSTSSQPPAPPALPPRRPTSSSAVIPPVLPARSSRSSDQSVSAPAATLKKDGSVITQSGKRDDDENEHDNDDDSENESETHDEDLEESGKTMDALDALFDDNTMSQLDDVCDEIL